MKNTIVDKVILSSIAVEIEQNAGQETKKGKQDIVLKIVNYYRNEKQWNFLD